MRSKAKTVAEYLKELPADRRAAIEAVRKVVRANVDGDIEEGMQYGAIGYYLPHRVFPAGYHCDPSEPLPYLGIASQKQYMAVYLFCSYMSGSSEEEWIRQAYAKAGRPLDMGKACLRFKSLEALDLEILAEAIRRVPTRTFVERYVAALGPRAAKTASGSGNTARDTARNTARDTARNTARKTAKRPATTKAKTAAKKVSKKTAGRPARKK